VLGQIVSTQDGPEVVSSGKLNVVYRLPKTLTRVRCRRNADGAILWFFAYQIEQANKS